MVVVNKRKIVLFGAGKIGRSFIGPLFHKSGYELVFIDKDKSLVDELNRRQKYKLIIKSDTSLIVHTITNLRGVCANDLNGVVDEVATAGIVTVAVGVNAVNSVIPLLAKGLLKRYQHHNKYPLDIIIAENLRDGADHFRKGLLSFLPPDYPLDQLAGLIETSIGKMVPIMQQKEMLDDKLQIFAEPYNTLILDKKGFKNPIPVVEGLAPKDNIRAWVDRKLFVHNLGHASIAYSGHLYNPAQTCMWEALQNPEIYRYARNTMLQASLVLMDRYPDDFTYPELEEHIDDLLSRFKNKALGDTIFRVGCDLGRKLSSNDRLAGAIKLAVESGLPYDKILFALVCGCHFRAKDEDGNMFKDDIGFLDRFNTDIPLILKEISGFSANTDKQLIEEAEQIDREIKRFGFSEVIKKFCS